jgi:hypothetical protein
VQAPVINACCIIWDAFLSHRNALAKHARIEADHAGGRPNDAGAEISQQKAPE